MYAPHNNVVCYYDNFLLQCVQHRTMESVLDRGEKLDDLVGKSEELSIQSKAFYKTVVSITLPTLLFLFLLLYKTVLSSHWFFSIILFEVYCSFILDSIDSII